MRRWRTGIASNPPDSGNFNTIVASEEILKTFNQSDPLLDVNE